MLSEHQSKYSHSLGHIHYLPEKQQDGRVRADRDMQLPNNIYLESHKPGKVGCSA
jgi:hypothetical protein